MAAIIDLKLVAYGNTAQKSDGSFDCQHGAGECETDVMDSCVEVNLSDDKDAIATGSTAMQAWPFILCMEEADGNPSKGESCYESSMSGSTNVTWSTINDCVQNDASEVQTQAMKATPSHDYVPWVIVDNSQLENTNMLQKAVCDAYTGTPPESCLNFKEETESRCYNN